MGGPRGRIAGAQPPPGDYVLKPLLNFVASVAMVSGALLVVEAAVTVAWQEPISALRAAQAQASLEDELDGLTSASRGDQEALPAPRLTRRDIMAKLALRQERRAETGEAIGEIEIPAVGASFVMVEGAGVGPLRKGPGHYEGTPFPGRRGTVAIAGHRTTYLAPFRRVDELGEGDAIKLSMPYADLTYQVEATKIVGPDDVWVTRSVGRERLVLTACHPLYSAAERIVVFASLDQFSLRGEQRRDR